MVKRSDPGDFPPRSYGLVEYAPKARGFLFGAAVALRASLPLVPLRKPGKLPAATLSEPYELEYGTDRVEIHRDAVGEGETVLIVDDLLATGGTALATLDLLRQAGADIVGCSFVVDLPDLGGRKRLEEQCVSVLTLVEFEGE